MLRSLGRKQKIGFAPGSHWTLKLLAKMKWVRGTPFDVFGYARVRRVERSLIHHYRDLVLGLAKSLTPENFDRAVRIASFPDIIRGYEDIKLSNVKAYCDALESEKIDALLVKQML